MHKPAHVYETTDCAVDSALWLNLANLTTKLSVNPQTSTCHRLLGPKVSSSMSTLGSGMNCLIFECHDNEISLTRQTLHNSYVNHMLMAYRHHRHVGPPNIDRWLYL
jgi:hypothetical protein